MLGLTRMQLHRFFYWAKMSPTIQADEVLFFTGLNHEELRKYGVTPIDWNKKGLYYDSRVILKFVLNTTIITPQIVEMKRFVREKKERIRDIERLIRKAESQIWRREREIRINN